MEKYFKPEEKVIYLCAPGEAYTHQYYGVFCRQVMVSDPVPLFRSEDNVFNSSWWYEQYKDEVGIKTEPDAPYIYTWQQLWEHVEEQIRQNWQIDFKVFSNHEALVQVEVNKEIYYLIWKNSD